jgi:hypothetical protein
VLETASYLRVPGLLELRCDFLSNMPGSENCIGIMCSERDYYCSGLESDAGCFVMLKLRASITAK